MLRTSILTRAAVRSRSLAFVANPVEWKRAVPVVKAVKKAAEAEEKKPRKLLSLRNFAIMLGTCAVGTTVVVQGCKRSLDFRESIASQQPPVFAKIREWFETGKLKSEMTIWELNEALPTYVPEPETRVIVKLRSGTVVEMWVDSKTKNDEFVHQIELAVAKQMGESWTLAHDPVIDVAFADESQSDGGFTME